MQKLILTVASAAISGSALAVFPTTVYHQDVSGPMQNLVRIALNETTLGTNQRVVLYRPDLTTTIKSYNGFTGLLTTKIQDPTGTPVKLRDMLCIELEATASANWTNYGKWDAWGRAGWLVKQMSTIKQNVKSGTWTTLQGGQHMSGLQIALWEVVYDVIANGDVHGANLNTGVFRHLNGTNYLTVKGIAQSYLDASEGKKAGYWYYTSPVTYQGNGVGRQDYASAIPGPAALAPFAIGLITVLRKRSRKA
jgi:hypothetical protein